MKYVRILCKNCRESFIITESNVNKFKNCPFCKETKGLVVAK